MGVWNHVTWSMRGIGAKLGRVSWLPSAHNLRVLDRTSLPTGSPTRGGDSPGSSRTPLHSVPPTCQIDENARHARTRHHGSAKLIQYQLLNYAVSRKLRRYRICRGIEDVRRYTQDCHSRMDIITWSSVVQLRVAFNAEHHYRDLIY